ncbi:hypothetical protein [Baekduia sp. Peel2402]|uniref:hypothetical protein n=1 Tax=Baekduia sp. Peel2402 TaxID=3458296 RepID=UPI00403E895E
MLLALLALTIAPAQAGAMSLTLPTVGAAAVETTADSATITVPVMPLGLSANWHVEYGLTTSYGGTTVPISLPLTGGLAQMRTTITGLAADGHYHYRSVLSGPWTVPVVTPDATFDTTTAVIGIDDGDLGGISSLGIDDGGGDDYTPGTGTTPTLATQVPTPTPTSAPTITPATPVRTPAPSVAGPSAIVTARAGTVAIALSGSPTSVTLKLPARAATRARLAITTAGRTRTARLQGSRSVRIGSARARVTTGRIVISRLPAKTTAVRVTPSAGTTVTARQVTATAS